MTYRVRVRTVTGSVLEAVPFAIADFGDGDNIHALGSDVESTRLAIEFPERLVVHPRGDRNPRTRVEIAR